jgi:7-keto-8-aminopelargonate synthetase-like enzyme
MLIVTDGLFSMDGDVAPLRRLLEMANEHEAWLLVDDAHGTGVLGDNGSGAFEHCGVIPAGPVIQMGTLSKALGSVGGFIAGPQVLADYLVNRSRTLIYSTGLPASAVAAALAALTVARREPWRRTRLAAAAEMVRRRLRELGLRVLDGPGPIVPVLLGESGKAMRWMDALMDGGCFVPGVRPPTVPEGEARLRVSLMATHTDEHVERLLGAFERLARENAA